MRISTHTPLTGRDTEVAEKVLDEVISTHTPLTGRDLQSSPNRTCPVGFLLTRPSRDVTYTQISEHMLSRISTHTPLTGRDMGRGGFDNRGSISTHTPLTGRDLSVKTFCPRSDDFYSHAPHGT